MNALMDTLTNILIIDLTPLNNPLFKNEFVKPIENILIENNLKYTIIHYRKLKPNDINNFTKIIISGTGLKDEEYLNYINNFSWIKNTKKNILGICAGSQIIATQFNAKITKNCEIGIFKAKIIKNSPIIFNENLNEIYCLHNNSFSINENFEIIAKTKTTQIFKIKNKNIFGTLFHPEIKNKNIILNFLSENKI
ncbi:MAG: hypothetical protein KC550_05510 [Nanoarchaeota archaeon]|nr:hypothetical protein [Nanoarchaeota archaeon]